MPSIEEMQKELDAAGYRVRLQVKASYIALPFEEDSYIGDVIIQAVYNNKDELIKYAYAHLQKERQFEAMKALLEEYLELPYSNSEQDFRDKVEAILGKQG